MSLRIMASVALALGSAAHHQNVTGCGRTYTVSMAVRAIDATYGSDLPATVSQTGRLKRYIRCQRHPTAEPYLLRVWKGKSTVAPLHGPALASWYYDGDSTGCGFHATYGVATFVGPCGARVQICSGSSCVVATRDDSGPYVGGRTFDLDPATRAALGCADLCAVKWRLLQGGTLARNA